MADRRTHRAGPASRLDFQYSLTATSINDTTVTWADVNALDFTGPNLSTTAGALDGNAAANRASVSSTISGLSIPAGGAFWIRWTDFDAAPGADDGLAVDDLAIQFVTDGGATATPTSTATPTTTGTPPATSTATPTATATNTPVVGAPTRIRDIQGASHPSPSNGQMVTNVSGIVTAKRTDGTGNNANTGFYLQDPSPDADDATSEAIFVRTQAGAASVNVGDAVTVLTGIVREWRPGCSTQPAFLDNCATTASGYNNLTLTWLVVAANGDLTGDLDRQHAAQPPSSSGPAGACRRPRTSPTTCRTSTPPRAPPSTRPLTARTSSRAWSSCASR